MQKIYASMNGKRPALCRVPEAVNFENPSVADDPVAELDRCERFFGTTICAIVATEIFVVALVSGADSRARLAGQAVALA
jgi:hypothetical protein